MCIPSSGWNGALFVYAHGYVAPNQPIAIEDPTFGGAPLSIAIQLQSYAFATTSYRRTGLAILEGIEDIRELVAAFPAVAGKTPTHTYLVGFSEGGLISTMLAERSSTLFSGVLAACGPIGDFQNQIDYFGDFRVLFDYFFPGRIPPSATNIPQAVVDTWASTYLPAIGNAVTTTPVSATQLISTSLAPIDPAQPTTIVSTTEDVLWYNIFATNDARARLGGNPYSNISRLYAGSNDDAKLNSSIQRFSADAAALAAVAAYQTKGQPRVPLILLHTTGDDVIPFWQATLYIAKAQRSRNVTRIPVSAYGHCAFSASDLFTAFGLLVQQAATVRPQIFVALATRD
jgi:pimeloyl-ACP methyl ester carboxylesterase